MSLIDPITARMSPARPQNVPQTPSEAGSASKTTGAESVTWDLSQMFASVSDLKQTLADSLSMAESFALAYRGNVAALDIDGLAAAMKEMETLQDGVGKAYTYAYLNWSTDTADAERGALLQHVRESYTTIAGHLLFFELEWTQVEDKRAAELLSDGSLSFCRHYLEVARLQKPYLLSEEGERVMMEKGNTGRSAWNRFFDETLSDMRFEVDGVAMTQQQVLARLHDKDRETRRVAAEAFTQGLKASSRPLTFIFNTILADKALDDRLRGYPSWITSRNMSNEVADEDVEALIGAVQDGYVHVQRFYSIKQRLLGLETMTEYDRYAPIGEADRHIDWDTAREMVLSSYTEFHPQMGAITKRFFDENWIDAALGEAKRGGAFSHGAVPSTHPYILMNYTGKIRDVQTLAHELGHGVHQYLSREQGIFHADTPLTTAETASVFGEMLVFQRLMREETDPANRLAMLMGKIDDTIATVFRQVSMNRFENRIHHERREKGELSTADLSEAWMDTQRPMFGDSVTLSENYAAWWSYIPHFLHTPGYVYAYAFGELLVLALYQRYQEQGESFADAYLDLLRSGGSDWPHVLVGRLGVDLRDPAFWAGGVQAIGALVDQAEELSRQVN
ncbi:MAG: M3 family oligoendopeptidase [Bacteroidetes bacterium]|nr:M3 family oligoendopeptidase [Bacteroidota bacterium]